MSKNKPKGSKKSKASDDLLEAATDSLKKFRRFAKQVNKLSTTQKIVGGLAVLAAGYAVLANTSPDEADADTPALAEPVPPPGTLSILNPARAPKPKRTKPASPAKRVPFSEEHS